jgi:integrase
MSDSLAPFSPSDLIEVEHSPARQSPALVYIASLPSPNSQRVMRLTLNGIIRLMTDQDGELPKDAYVHFPWAQLRYQETQAIRARLLVSMPPATVNRHLSALRGVMKECWRLGLIDAETYRRAVDLENVKGESQPVGRDIPDHELRRILLSCHDDENRGVRNFAALAILATCGLRRAEMEGLTLADFDLATGDLTVYGKGRKTRQVTVLNRARVALDRWIAIRGDAPGPLFYAFGKGDRMKVGKPWRADDLYNFIKDRAKELRLKKVTPHDFRRTFIGNALDADVDAVLLTAITGHASVDMLKKYDRRPQRARRDAQKKIDLPI